MRFLKSKKRYETIEPDEILIDAQNLPGYDARRLEGKIERPIEPSTFRYFALTALTLGLVFVGQLVRLQVVDASMLSARAEANRLEEHIVIAERGLITDRRDEPLAISTPESVAGFSTRAYPLGEAAAHLVGYVSYPKRDQNGFWFQTGVEGRAGIEQSFDLRLRGRNGSEIKEVTATGEVASGSVVRTPEEGETVHLSVDAGLQESLFKEIKARADSAPFVGGSGAIMNVETGEILALVSYPSFDPEIVSVGAPVLTVEDYLSDTRAPFLDRAIAGLYTPGSVVKPFVAVAALEQGLITPEKKILSTGSISVPNQFDPTHPSIFKDWRAHGWVDMRHALAVSSDVYFYAIGGGFEEQQGLGISAIDEYLRKFGIAEATGIALQGEEEGTIPTPAWKAEQFDGERWYLGDTYHTAIGQYGFQTTPLELTRGIAAIANGGMLVTPTLERDAQGRTVSVGVSPSSLAVVREGMRMAVNEGGTAAVLSIPGLAVAAKTGTAQVGVRNELTNSVIVGFFPYERPRYAFTIIMERSKAGTALGAPAVMRNVLDWIVINRSEMTGAVN